MAKKDEDERIIQYTLEGEIFWPSFYKTDQYDKFGCVLGNLTQEEVDKAEAANLKVNESEDFGSFVRLHMKEMKKDPKTGDMVKNDPLEIADFNTRKRWNPKTGIGNGTTAVLRGISIRYDDKDNKWTNKLQKVRIKKLVPYEINADEDAWDIIEDDTPEETSEDTVAELSDEGDDLPVGMQEEKTQADALSQLD